MTMLSMKARRSGMRAKGFSLLEVLIAIVVLSVGLLALGDRSVPHPETMTTTRARAERMRSATMHQAPPRWLWPFTRSGAG